MASYLDNDLDPEAVAEFEKRCLTSDVNLAEVASVHQILSLLGQKVKVPDAARTRMYQLVKGRETVAHAARAGREAGREGAGDQADPALGRAGGPEAPLDRAVRSRRGLRPADLPVDLGGAGEPDACRRRRPSARALAARSRLNRAAVAGGSTKWRAAGEAAKSQPDARRPHPRPGRTRGPRRSTAKAADPEKAKPAPPPTVPAGVAGLAEKSDGILLRYNEDRARVGSPRQGDPAEGLRPHPLPGALPGVDRRGQGPPRA